MKLKVVSFIILVAALCAFAQTGLMGGSDGIHQMNAKTVGQWGFFAGTGGNVTIDPWAIAREGVYYDDAERVKLQHFKLSATGNFFIGLGVLDNVDIGIGIPINYDRSYAYDYWEATSNIRQGDLDMWMKIKAPFIGDSSVVDLAAQFDLYMPTGRKALGLRPRHAWFIQRDGSVNPYTANEIVAAANAIMTVDGNKRDIPLRWNVNIGFVYANEGTNTLVYGTGVDWDVFSWATAFVEYSGEFRVEKSAIPRDFWEDPMVITPGARLHLPYNVDLAGGFDLSTRMMRVGYDREKEMSRIDEFTIGYIDQKGRHKTYGYVPTVNYAFTGLLIWHFDAPQKAPEPVCYHPTVDTVMRVDTLMRVDTIVVADTILDSDGDGVVDSLDMCPGTMARAAVDSVGCMIDSDKDGVPDVNDKCPNTQPGIEVDRDGCPRDFDGDGVPDYRDMCPNSQPGVAVDSTGCAKDEDMDGVADDFDKCPATPKGVPVDTTGCPMDTDGDGVPDYQDKCPNSLRGVKVDKVGCPVNKKEDLDNLKKGINFKSGSTELTKASFKTLNDIVNLMTKFADVSLEIQGHTDNTGDSLSNENLSQGRAQSAVDYLAAHGITEDRLRAAGYGQRKPIADNKTKKGRAKNRRVELVPFYKD